MPSKPTEILPVGAPVAGTDLVHLAQFDGARFNSRQVTLALLAAFVASANIPLIGVDTVAGTAYPVVAADNYRHKRFTNAGAVTVTVPANASVAIPIGTRIRMTQAGAGQVTLAPQLGVVLRSFNDAFKSAGLNAVFEIEKVGTDEWDVLGHVTT